MFVTFFQTCKVNDVVTMDPQGLFTQANFTAILGAIFHAILGADWPRVSQYGTELKYFFASKRKPL